MADSVRNYLESKNLGIVRPEKKSLSEMITDQLAEMIQKGILSPGTHLVQNEWADTFNVSRVAIRDAILQLLQRGLVENIPQKGYVVKTVSLEEIENLFEARRCVESLAAKKACEHMTREGLIAIEEMLAEQEKLCSENRTEEFMENDVIFHMTIYQNSDNKVLFEIIERLWFRARQARNLIKIDSAHAQEGIQHSLDGHRKILSALKEGDCERFVSEVINAINRSEREIEEIVKLYFKEEKKRQE